MTKRDPVSRRRLDRLADVAGATLVSTGAAANYLGLSRPTLVGLIDRGVIPSTRRGRTRVVTFDTLELYARAVGGSKLPGDLRAQHPALDAILRLIPEDRYAVGGPAAIAAHDPSYRSGTARSSIWTTTLLINALAARAPAGFIVFTRDGLSVALTGASSSDQIRVVEWPGALGRQQTVRSNDGVRVLEPNRLVVSCAMEEAARERLVGGLIGDEAVDFERLAVLVSRPWVNLGLVRRLFDRGQSSNDPLAIPIGHRQRDLCVAPLAELIEAATILVARVVRTLSEATPSGAVLDPASVRARRAIVPLERSAWRALARVVKPAPLALDRLSAALAR